MPLPIFYTTTSASQNETFTLEEDTSRHIAQVLRMKEGEQLQLTDGLGSLLKAEIVHEHKKATQVRILSVHKEPISTPHISIAISLVKNASRFEWFLEKATEIGVSEIIPLLCERTEKQHFRFDRMKNILVSAMLQSQQVWLPGLRVPVSFRQVVEESRTQQKFIAHCREDKKEELRSWLQQPAGAIILIGPEGDFTKEEIELALQHHYLPVSLGQTRLRTETAGMAAAVLLKAG
ncbi:MAG: 16S rRNA (uracil(1498)-N(3))-methyltransferase [Williamsia sp.]|nr:16S rRNA (uracil(1498)-N(3))-methyltransferase [Williamsia sp.]